MNKIVDTLVVAAMLMTSVPSLADAPMLTLTPAHEQTAPSDTIDSPSADDTKNDAQANA